MITHRLFFGKIYKWLTNFCILFVYFLYTFVTFVYLAKKSLCVTKSPEFTKQVIANLHLNASNTHVDALLMRSNSETAAWNPALHQEHLLSKVPSD